MSFEEQCGLCAGTGAPFAADRTRTYLRCPVCDLVFVPAGQRLGPTAEKARYDYHENDPADEGYRRFLGKLFHPLQERLAPGSEGLDFGCGPGPTLHLLFMEAGFSMQLYDPFYYPDATVLDERYDFITVSEVAEHLYHPREDLDRIWGCLKPGGLLGIMTKFVPVNGDFATWHYRNDDTHVCFYSARTFSWLAGHWGASLTALHGEVAIFEKEKP